MNAKEKAKELVDRFKTDGLTNNVSTTLEDKLAKQCALICVEEIFEYMKQDDLYSGTASNANSKWPQYWNEVKTEIEKL